MTSLGSKVPAPRALVEALFLGKLMVHLPSICLLEKVVEVGTWVTSISCLCVDLWVGGVP